MIYYNKTNCISTSFQFPLLNNFIENEKNSCLISILKTNKCCQLNILWHVKIKTLFNMPYNNK